MMYHDGGSFGLPQWLYRDDFATQGMKCFNFRPKRSLRSRILASTDFRKHQCRKRKALLISGKRKRLIAN